MKKGFIFLFIVLFLNSVSAFSLDVGGFLDKIGYENLFLLTIFATCLALINFSLSKFFARGGSNSARYANLISILISLLITFYVYQSGLDIEGFVSGIFDYWNLDFGLSGWFAVFIIVLLFLNMVFKFKLGFLVFLTGFIVLFLGIFSDLYQPFVATGIFLMVLGVVIMEVRKIYSRHKEEKKAKNMSNYWKSIWGS